MMISPDGYIEELEDKSYINLLKERDLLIREICRFEKDKDCNGEEWMMCPSPNVIYQMNLQYLGRLCELISKVYNRDYVWGDMKR